MVDDEETFVVVLIGAWRSDVLGCHSLLNRRGRIFDIRASRGYGGYRALGCPARTSLSLLLGTLLNLLAKVVNALLTQLDKLKHRKNVLVMATSNLAEAIGNVLITLAKLS